MQIFFVIVPSIMIAGILAIIYGVINRSRRVSRAWGSGLTAEARCLRTYTTTRSTGGERNRVRSVLHHVYEFSTRDGRTVRFEEENGPGTVLEGDIVTVFYSADRPEQATAMAPAHGRLFAESGAALAFLGVALVFCVVFLITAQTAFDGWNDVMP